MQSRLSTDSLRGRRLRPILLGLFATVFLGTPGWCSEETISRDAKPTPLAHGKPVLRQLAGGDSHTYTVELAAGAFARIAVRQLGLDVRIRVRLPDKPGELEENGLQGSRGTEVVLVATEAAGTLSLEVHAFDASAVGGSYEIVLEHLENAPSPAQLAAARAWLAMTNANRLGGQAPDRDLDADYLEAVALWRQAGDRRGEAETLYYQALYRDRRGDQRAAVELFTEALKLQRAAGDRVAEATTLADRGASYDDMGHPKEALADLEAAQAQFQQLADARGEARSLVGIASVHDKQGDHRRASEEYNAVLEICRRLGDRRCLGAILNNLGRLHSLNGEPQEALGRYREALELWQAIGHKTNSAWTIMNIGALDESIGRPREALVHYATALRLHRETGDRRGEASTLHNRAAANADLGETQQAIDDYEQSLRLRRETADRRGEGTALTNLAKLYSDLGDTPRALELYRQSLVLHQASQTKYSEANTRYQLGRLYESLGRFPEADEEYRSALALWQETGSRRKTGLALAARGSVALASGRPETALTFQQEALAQLRKAQNRHGEAEALTSLARTLAALDRIPEALGKLADALTIERELGDRAAEAETLFTRAALTKSAGDHDAAQAAIEGALARVNELRARVLTSNLRAKYLANKRRYVRFLIDLLMERAERRPGEGFRERAFEANEQFLARNLLDSLVLRVTDLHPEAGTVLVSREQELVTSIATLDLRQSRLVERDEHEQAARVERQLGELLSELDRVQTELLQVSPHYADLTQPRILSVAEIQSQILDGNTLVLEYSLGPEKSFLWMISRAAVRSAELPARAVVERSVGEFLEILQAGPHPLARHRLAEAAGRLSEMLLEPAGHLTGFSRLLIVPDGALQRIPFAMLTPAGRQGAPLVASHEIVLLPSMSVLGALRRSRPTPPPTRRAVAIFADPVFSRDDPRLMNRQAATRSESTSPSANVARWVEDFGETSLPRLPESLKEARAIRELLPADQVFLALSFDAHKALLFDGSLDATRVLHFATHALLNEKHPELSALVLSLIDPQGGEQDGLLRLSEIYNLRLTADLVMLSACRTALGQEIEGEGLLGLTRGFLHAGASAVVASLWKVDDRATSELMKRTYRKMFKEGLPASAALKEAQMSMWVNGWHPYDWAGFIFQGDWLARPTSGVAPKEMPAKQ